MAAISETEFAEYRALAEVVFNPSVPDEERLPKIEQIISIREHFGWPLDFTMLYGARTRVNVRPYHREAECIRERMREAFEFGEPRCD